MGKRRWRPGCTGSPSTAPWTICGGGKPGRNVLLVRIKIGKSRAGLILTYRGDGVKAVLPE